MHSFFSFHTAKNSIIFPAVFACLVGSVLLYTSQARVGTEHDRQSSFLAGNFLRFVRIRDTVFITGDRYLHVSLKTQTVTLHMRSGDTLSFRVSSGNKFLKDGMETPTGIFSVQSKSPMAVSKQFDDAKLHSWIGFNGNIGFHGLDGNSYYRFLGKRSSSHGCLRMAREEIAEMYKKVTIGTPVIVTDEEPARIFAFADTTEFDAVRSIQLTSKTPDMQALTRERLENLYAGKYLLRGFLPLYMDAKTKLRPGGYAVGFADSVAMSQERSFADFRNVGKIPRDAFSKYAPLLRFSKSDTTALSAFQSSLLPQE